jgi:hypothetical protein
LKLIAYIRRQVCKAYIVGEELRGLEGDEDEYIVGLITIDKNLWMMIFNL